MSVSIRYPQLMPTDYQSIGDSFDRAFGRARFVRLENEDRAQAAADRARNLKLDAEAGPLLADLYSGALSQGAPSMSLAALGAPVGQVQRAPLDDPSSARVAQAHASDAERQAMEFFIKKGWSPHQAAGIVGNLIQESGLKTGAINPGDGADGSNSIGVAQWNSDRARAFQAYAAQNGGNANDLATQLAFVDHELGTSENTAGQALRRASNPIQAAAAFAGYERPQAGLPKTHTAHTAGAIALATPQGLPVATMPSAARSRP